MQWETLEKRIKQECKEHRKSSKYTEKYLIWAKTLHTKDLPLIASPEHFSLLVGIEHQYVCNMAFTANKFYRHFSIKKSNGKKRDIYEPLPDLKYVQHWILENILEKIPVSEYAKAYIKNRTLKHNARFHRAQPVVVTMDIKDFFPSIQIFDVVSIFKEAGYWDNVAWFLAHLCCLNKKLPQGAPTSPYLSNIRMKKLDDEIVQYTSESKIRYTRYADDMTFSGNLDPHKLIPKISELVFNDGFQINSKKTRVAYPNTRQEVTGIVVNSHMQVPRKQRRYIRQQVHYITTYGLESHLEKIGENRANYINHLLGQINFALFVNPKDEELKRSL